MKSLTDIIKAMEKAMSGLGGLIFLFFVISQFVAYFNYTNMGTIMALKLADVLKAANIGPLLAAASASSWSSRIIDLLITGAIAKWAIFAPIFVPLLMKLGVEPEAVLAAYRVGDSPMNAITPLNAYFALVVGFAQKYDKNAGVGTVVSLMLPYVVWMFVLWTLLFAAWQMLGTSLGTVVERAAGVSGTATVTDCDQRMQKGTANMSTTTSPLDVKAAEDHLMRFLAVEGVTGQEAAIADAVTDELKKVGVPASAIRFDDANKRIPLPTQTGNLIVDLPGTRPGPRLLFSTHLDTVPLCAGAKPKREGDRIVSDGTTALGGDNRTGCAVLVALAETLLKHKLPHPPITLLFTVREESGLHGARELNPADLGGATMCFNVDGKLAAELIIGAVGQENWEVEIKGKASHAGVAPEKGISATLVGAVGPDRGAPRRLVRQGRQARRQRHQQSSASSAARKASRPATPPTSSPTTSTSRARRAAPRRPSPRPSARRIARPSPRRRREVKDAGGETAEVKFSSTAVVSAVQAGGRRAGRACTPSGRRNRSA